MRRCASFGRCRVLALVSVIDSTLAHANLIPIHADLFIIINLPSFSFFLPSSLAVIIDAHFLQHAPCAPLSKLILLGHPRSLPLFFFCMNVQMHPFKAQSHKCLFNKRTADGEGAAEKDKRKTKRALLVDSDSDSD